MLRSAARLRFSFIISYCSSAVHSIKSRASSGSHCLTGGTFSSWTSAIAKWYRNILTSSTNDNGSSDPKVDFYPWWCSKSQVKKIKNVIWKSFFLVGERKKRAERGGRERSVISRISPLCSLSLFLSGGLYVVFFVSLCWWSLSLCVFSSRQDSSLVGRFVGRRAFVQGGTRESDPKTHAPQKNEIFCQFMFVKRFKY